MAVWELVQDRRISGKGVLKIPTASINNRAYILLTDVIRDANSKYVNLGYNPSRGRLGTVAFVRNSYVVDSKAIEYDRQCFDGINDISGQVMIALKCSNNAILQSILNLSVALAATPGGQGLAPINFTNVIAAYENLRLAWDECRIVCYADTALQVRLYRLKYDTCNPDFDDSNAGVIPSAPITKVPVGTPISVSSPYVSVGSDNGNTASFPGDGSLPPSPCVTIIRGAGLNLSNCGQANNFGDYTYQGYAELKPTTVSNCSGLQVFLDGVSLGAQQVYHPTAIILSRTGDCIAPSP